jgi:hypothetical protein
VVNIIGSQLNMRDKLILAATTAVAITMLSGAASAQGIGIYIGPPAAYDYEYYGYGPEYRSYRPRVYGYRRYSDDDTYRVRRGGCGTYRYWDGDRCVDARYR